MKISGFFRRLIKNFIKQWSKRPFKSTIMWLFLPVIIFFIAVTGLISFFLAEQQIQENAYNSVNDLVTQTKSYLDNRMYDVFEQFVGLENDYDLISLERNVYEYEQISFKADSYINLNRSLNRIYTSYNSIIDSIYLNFNDGWFMLYRDSFVPSDVNFSFDEWKNKYPENEYYWLNLHEKSILNNQNGNKSVASLFKIIGNNGTNLRGFLMFNLNESFFKNILEEPRVSKNGYLVLISNDGVMQFKNVSEKYQMDDNIVNKIRTNEAPSGNFKFQVPGGTKMMVAYNTVKISNWRIAAIIPEDELLSKAKYIKYITFILVIILIMIGTALSSILAKVVSKPITDLTRKVKKVKEVDMEEDFSSDASNEAGILSNVINELIHRVKNLLVQVKEEQEQKRNAELRVLQAQINPHFLYNTLFSIKQLCDMGESKDASNMISALSNFFRIGISRGREVIKIEEEIEHVKNYLFIQHMRYSDDFRYEINIDQDILNCSIIKLTLQPLVENAIYHGVKQKRGRGLILISGYRKGKNIEIIVSDDGSGMTENKLQELIESLNENNDKKYTVSFGLRNVNDRLRIHYGSEYGISIESKADAGTAVKVKIPYTY